MRSAAWRLQPIGDYDIYGDPEPATWTYRLTANGPQRTLTETVAADQVIDVRYGTRGTSTLARGVPVGGLYGDGRAGRHA